MRNGKSALVLVALVVATVAVPLLARAEDPAGDCPNARWTLTSLVDVDGSVAGKAAAKDAKGNGDGYVCQKQNKGTKFQVKDNSKPFAPTTAEPPSEGAGCPSGAWVLTPLEAVDGSVTDKAAAKDAKGNGDGYVCQKQNKGTKFQVKDNNNPGDVEGVEPVVTDPEPTTEPGDTPSTA